MNNNQKNILLVANYASDVGYAWWLMENFWAEIADQFNSRSSLCFLMYPVVNELPPKIATSKLIVIKGDFFGRNLKEFLQTLKIVKNNNIKFIFLTDRAYFNWRYLALRLYGVKKIVNHDHMPGERTPPTPFKKLVKKIIHWVRIFSCDHYIGVSEFVKNRLISVACIPESKVSFVKNGIILFDNKKTDYVTNSFGIEKKAKIVVTTGRATFYKGIDLLIKAADIVINKNNFKNVFFLHVGSGTDLEVFKGMTRELNIDDNFIFTGYRTDVKKILPCCDIGVQTSLGEAFSLSIIEYLCAGLVTLAPNNCGNPEAIEDGVNGMLFESGNINELANKIIYVLQNDEFSDKLRKAGRKSVEERFTLERCNKQLISLLKIIFV